MRHQEPCDNTGPTRAVVWSLGEGARGQGVDNIIRFGERGLPGLEGPGWGDDGRDGNGFFYGGVMHTNTHKFAANKKPRQNLCNAVAWASYAPMRLHRQIAAEEC